MEDSDQDLTLENIHGSAEQTTHTIQQTAFIGQNTGLRGSRFCLRLSSALADVQHGILQKLLSKPVPTDFLDGNAHGRTSCGPSDTSSSLSSATLAWYTPSE